MDGCSLVEAANVLLTRIERATSLRDCRGPPTRRCGGSLVPSGAHPLGTLSGLGAGRYERNGQRTSWRRPHARRHTSPDCTMLTGSMALDEYRRKRDFRKTTEPAGTPLTSDSESLAFVVQQHAARRLHYDFRLELGGVMKSWAIPKGPSLDPAEKRLAVQVEDHPLEYAGFEGIIPKGQYGGGTVLLWDRGFWSPADPHPAAAYNNGMLKFALHGEKLRGNWMLVRLKRKPRDTHDNWLLVKERDEAARPGSGAAVVDDHPLSVESGRTLEEIAAAPERVWQSSAGNTEADPLPRARARAPKIPLATIPGARKGPLPEQLKPQLASAATKAPAGNQWLHEIKYDGYRIIARIDRGKVRLITRNGLDWTSKFPELTRRFCELPVTTALIDGELVFLMPDGKTNFSELQDAIASGRTGHLTFYAFDLLHEDGWDLAAASLEDRKASLADIILPDSVGALRYSDHQEGHGPAFFGQAKRFGLEGVVSKRRDGPYRPGRGRTWLKIKTRNVDEFVVVGFTDPGGQRAGFGALLLGYYDPQGRLRYAGRVGAGFSATQLMELRRQLDELRSVRLAIALPVHDAPYEARFIHWTRPLLVVEVEYAGGSAHHCNASGASDATGASRNSPPCPRWQRRLWRRAAYASRSHPLARRRVHQVRPRPLLRDGRRPGIAASGASSIDLAACARRPWGA